MTKSKTVIFKFSITIYFIMLYQTVFFQIHNYYFILVEIYEEIALTYLKIIFTKACYLTYNNVIAPNVIYINGLVIT